MLRNLAKKASADFKLFYTKASLKELKARALKRNETLAKEFQMKIEDLELAYNKFQEPTLEEEFIKMQSGVNDVFEACTEFYDEKFDSSKTGSEEIANQILKKYNQA